MSDTHKNQEPQDESAGNPSEDIQGEGSSESSSRLNDAKAFFRALNAGAELNPSETEMKTASSDTLTSAGCPSCEQMAHEVEQISHKLNEVDTHYKRMAADFENYRRRSERERDELQTLGVKRMVEALLPALDDIDRAKMGLNESMPAEKILESLMVVFNSLGRCLDQAGIKSMDVVGKPFDPRLHEPVQQIETTEFPDGCVMQELRRGYMLGDKVVRPALVNVASNSAQHSAEGQVQIEEACESEPEASCQSDEAEVSQTGVYELADVDESIEKTVDEYLNNLNGTQTSD